MSSDFSQHHLLPLFTSPPSLPPSSSGLGMADEVKIEKDAFNSRLSHLISTWKNDKRQSNDALFGGVGSIVILMGKNEENPAFHKNNAMHVCISIGPLADQQLIGAHVVLASWV